MTAWAYYNDNDAFVCAWVRELIKAGLVTDGEVDERPIQEVQPADLRGFSRCHFFCGIAGWDLALNLAGWDGGSLWTGSCPCQPFSAAGKGAGFSDPRHLWPAWFRLIRECRPQRIFGEQVASKAGLGWFDHVAADLETLSYAVGAADIPAAGVGAFHIRQRLWWVADRLADGRQEPESARAAFRSCGVRQPVQGGVAGSVADADRPERRPHTPRHDSHGSDAGGDQAPSGARACGEVLGLADTDEGGQRIHGTTSSARWPSGEPHPDERGAGDMDDAAGSGLEGHDGTGRAHSGEDGSARGAVGRAATAGGLSEHAGEQGPSGLQPDGPGARGLRDGTLDGMADTDEGRRGAPRQREGGEREGRDGSVGSNDGPAPTDSGASDPWSDVVWLPCRDGKARPAQPGIQPLVARFPNRVGLLRGAGNSICPQTAEAFIRAYVEVTA